MACKWSFQGKHSYFIRFQLGRKQNALFRLRSLCTAALRDGLEEEKGKTPHGN
jgi:hypothetical protein